MGDIAVWRLLSWEMGGLLEDMYVCCIHLAIACTDTEIVRALLHNSMIIHEGT